MDALSLKDGIKILNSLKEEQREAQKCGLPFMMASVVLWTIILVAQFLNVDQVTKNTITFSCSAGMMPLALIFGKLIGAHFLKKTGNPIKSLGFLCTMNQNLYLLAALWAYNQKPVGMLMVYAVIFAAHLLPFSWVYNCKPYMVFSIIETIGSFAAGIIFGNAAIALFIVVCQILLNVFIFANMRKDKQRVED